MATTNREAIRLTDSSLPRRVQRRSAWRQLAQGSAATATICAGAGLAADAAAGIVYMDTPLHPDSQWDVDGDGTTDFVLTDFNFSTTGREDLRVVTGFVTSAAGGRGFVNHDGSQFRAIQNLPVGSRIGPDLAEGNYWGDQGRRTMFEYRYRHYTFGTFSEPQTSWSISSAVRAPGFVDRQDGFTGFRFEASDGVHHGWARLGIDLSLRAFTIKEWAYNDELDEPIRVGQTMVPEPGSAALAGLGALAAGAAGVRRWRRTRRNYA